MKTRASLTFGFAVVLSCVAIPGAWAQQRAETATMTEPEEEDASVQPVSDTWITTKVKTDLLATPEVSGTAIDVDTVNGVVSLKGTVDTQAHADRAIELTKGIKGVKRVDSSGLKVGKAKSNY